MVSHSDNETRIVRLVALGYSMWIAVDAEDLALIRRHYTLIPAIIYHTPGCRIWVYRSIQLPLTGNEAINIARRHLSGMLATVPQN